MLFQYYTKYKIQQHAEHFTIKKYFKQVLNCIKNIPISTINRDQLFQNFRKLKTSHCYSSNLQIKLL